MKRFAFSVLLAVSACSDSSSMEVNALRIHVTFSDAECRDLGTMLVTVTVGSETFTSAESTQDFGITPGQTAHWDLTWPSAIGSGAPGMVTFSGNGIYGLGRGRTAPLVPVTASGEATFTAAPPGLQTVDMSVHCTVE